METVSFDVEWLSEDKIRMTYDDKDDEYISFYQKDGFEIIGYDRFAYSNERSAEQNMRIEMGKKL